MLTINKIIDIETVFSAFEETFKKDYVYKGERHNFWELVCVTDGFVGVSSDDKIYSLSKGDVIFHKPMEFHRIWSEKGSSPSVLIVSFSTSTVGNKLDFLSKGIFKINDELFTYLHEAVKSACICTGYEDETTLQLISNNIERFILLLMKSEFPVTPSKKTIGTLNYQRIISILNDNVDKRLNCDEIANLCNMSVPNLKKTFKYYSGIGVIEYFNRLKVNKAIKMMEKGMSVSQISDALDFSAISYFVAVFKRYTGMTPTEYKKSFTNEKYIYSI